MSAYPARGREDRLDRSDPVTEHRLIPQTLSVLRQKLSQMAKQKLRFWFYMLYYRRLRDAELRSIAVWKSGGYTNEEIATMLGCKSRTIERKLKLIRAILGEEHAP